MNNPTNFITKNPDPYLKELPGITSDFQKTFDSIFVQTDLLNLHAIVGGDGPPLLLLCGWPQFWYAWRFIMPELAEKYTVIAADPRGVNLSDKPIDGYDSATLAADMVMLMERLGYSKFAMVGHDVGMWTAYALASDFPDKLNCLAMIDATIPGLSPSPPLLGPEMLNERLWHFAFNRASGINEQLVIGREEIYFGYQLRSKAATPTAIPDYAVSVYINALKTIPGALSASFNFYSCLNLIMDQNMERKKRKLEIPILTIGGGKASNLNVKRDMDLVAYNVANIIIPNCGHFVAEEEPEQLLIALNEFLDKNHFSLHDD